MLCIDIDTYYDMYTVDRHAIAGNTHTHTVWATLATHITHFHIMNFASHHRYYKYKIQVYMWVAGAVFLVARRPGHPCLVWPVSPHTKVKLRARRHKHPNKIVSNKILYNNLTLSEPDVANHFLYPFAPQNIRGTFSFNNHNPKSK